LAIMDPFRLRVMSERTTQKLNQIPVSTATYS
jgi:hypothetical protein